MLLPLAEIPVNVIASYSNQPSRPARRRGPQLCRQFNNPNIGSSHADPGRHDLPTTREHNLATSEEVEQLVFPHPSNWDKFNHNAELAVASEIDDHAYGKTEGLIDSFLGDEAQLINEITERVYRALVKNKTYDSKTRIWKDIPTQPTNDKVIYIPLAIVLNKILELCDEAEYEVYWRDECPSPPEIKSQERRRYLVKETRATRLRWRAIHSLIEVKKSEDEPAGLQLLRYIHSTLREQPDRRFMYGFVFARRSLTLWQVDRSGSLAARPFDVHKDPKQFIRVIVGLFVKSPESLGWDPTMLRFVIDEEHPNGHALPSYSVKDAYSASGPYTHMWITTVDAPSSAAGSSHKTSTDGKMDNTASDTSQQHFIFYTALSLAREEILRGRATRIWLAWKFDDMDKDQKDRKVYVFKDAWRAERLGLEGDAYREGPGVTKVYSCSAVRINGRRDDTLNLIRGGVELSEDRASLIATGTNEVQTSIGDHTRRRYLYRFPSVVRDPFADFAPPDILEKVTLKGGPYNRLHTRLVIETYGLPLTRFRSLPEVVGALHDSIQGHEFLCSQGILHRDISQSSIMIIPEPQTERGFRGVLIDLDFAVETNTGRLDIAGDEQSGTKAFMSGELLTGEAYKVLQFKPLVLSDFKLTAATAKRKPRSPSVHVVITHDVVHDLESFFWVLCWLCVSYEGPSTRRTHAWHEDKAVTTNLKKEIRTAFESTNPWVLASQKTALLIHSDPDDSNLEQWCTPYFRPLIPLIVGLHATLKGAYSMRTFTKLHTDFREQLAFAETMEEVPTWNDTEPKYRSQEESEMATRQRERDGLPTEDNSPKWKPKEEMQTVVEARHRKSNRRGNTNPVERAGPSSSGLGQKRSVRFEKLSGEGLSGCGGNNRKRSRTGKSS